MQLPYPGAIIMLEKLLCCFSSGNGTKQHHYSHLYNISMSRFREKMNFESCSLTWIITGPFQILCLKRNISIFNPPLFSHVYTRGSKIINLTESKLEPCRFPMDVDELSHSSSLRYMFHLPLGATWEQSKVIKANEKKRADCENTCETKALLFPVGVLVYFGA